MSNLDQIFHQIVDMHQAKANSAEAKKMEDYLRNQFSMLGIKSPVRAEILKPINPTIKALDFKDKLDLCYRLWDMPEREYQYVALEILKKYFKKSPQSFLNDIHFFIVNKSWWDTVDIIASNPLGQLLKENSELQDQMDLWITDENMWIRRSALIFQLKYKENTDSERLFRYCKLCMHEQDFFIRKAIGWALRQYFKFSPELVIKFVDKHEGQLSELSKKEALKHR